MSDDDATFEISKEVPPVGRVAGIVLAAICVALIGAAIWTPGDDRYGDFACLAGVLAFIVGAEFKASWHR